MNRTSGNPSGQVILDFHIARAWEKRFSFYDKDEDGNLTPHDVTGDSWEFFIKKYPGAREKELSLTNNNGLTFTAYDGNAIDVSVTATQSNIEEGEYYYELYNDTEDRTYASQNCYFSYRGTNPSGEDGSIQINITDDTVEVILVNSAGSATVSTDGITIFGDGSASNPLYTTGSGLQAANNLSDVASALTSRQNLQAAHDRLTVFSKSSSFDVALTDFYSAGTRKTNPEYNVTATATATLYADADQNIPVGYVANFRVNTGITLTFAAGAGATVTTQSGGSTLVGAASPSGGKYGFAVKTAANTWFVANGDPASGSQMILTFVAAVLTHTNLPAGVQRVSNVANRYGLRADLTNASTIRAGVAVSLAGYAGSGWYIRYSTDGTNYNDIGTASGSNLALMTSAGINVSDAITIPAGAKSFVWLEIVSILGDGVADPVTGTLFAVVN